MAREGELFLAGLDVPERHALIRDRGQGLVVRTESQAFNPRQQRSRGGCLPFFGTAGSEADHQDKETRRQEDKKIRRQPGVVALRDWFAKHKVNSSLAVKKIARRRFPMTGS